MALSGDMSQEDILELIQSQKQSGLSKAQKRSGAGKSLEDDSDEDLLEPSTQNRTSNRKGGGIRAGNVCSHMLDLDKTCIE